MNNTILLVDQRNIPASFDSESLFVNERHILDVDDSTDYPIEAIAQNMAYALQVPIIKITLSESALARYMAEKTGDTAAFENALAAGEDLDDWGQGYTCDDVLGAVARERYPVSASAKGL